MIAFPTKPIRLFAAASALFFAASGGALAMEHQFADDNCAINIPDGWRGVATFSSQPDVIAAYNDPAELRCVVVRIYSQKPSKPLDDSFIAGFENEFVRDGGGDRVSGKYIGIGGIKCYERLGQYESHGKHVSTLIQIVPGEDLYYIVVAVRYGLTANEDGEIRQVIDSFRFIHPFVPSYGLVDSDSIAYGVGRLMGGLLVIIVAAAVVVGAVRASRN